MSTKLYFYECGTLKSQKHLFTLNKNIGEPFEVPVPFFLIQHNGKNILFDTGNALETAKNPKNHWGEITDIYYPVMEESQYVVNQLKNSLEIKPEDIDYVILSHLHLDHAGGVGAFPNALYVAHKREIEWAFSPNCPQKAAYIMADIDKNIKWLTPEIQNEEPYDLFNDGVIGIYHTPGHTPGHLSVLVNLQSKPFLLTSDSCYTEENLNENIPPGLVWDEELSTKTVKWMQKLQKEKNVEVIVGHDPKAWKRFKKAPQYYS